MTFADHEPPAIARRLLAWVLPHRADGLAILGDLLEEFRERAARDGAAAARWWYRRQALALGVHWLLNPDRLRRLIAQAFWDFRLAARSVAAAPAVMAAIVLTIGVAVGANTALFSVFDGLLFRPLPYREADRIVHLAIDQPAIAALSREALQQALAQAAGTPSMVVRAVAAPASLFDPAGAAAIDWELRAFAMSPSAFDLLGVRPMLGRPFVDADRSARHSVLLGYDVWRSRFGGDTEIVGRVVEIPRTAPEERWHVVGVMPPGFAFPDGANFWVARYNEPRVMPFARLAPGVTLQALRAELPHLTITPLREYVRPSGALALGVLLVATSLMLCVAWVQVAALVFSRATGRVVEIGVRLALGATRARLGRQFAIEGAVLALLALGVAALTAPALVAFIVYALPAEMTIGHEVQPDGRALLFATALSAVGLVVIAILPVHLIRQSSPLRLLRAGTSGHPGLHATRIRRALFVGQLAIATSLIYLAGLAVKSFVAVGDVPLGYDVADLYAIRMPRGDSLFSGGARGRFDQRRAAVAETIEALRAVPGVKSATGANAWPMRLDSVDVATLVPDADPDRHPLTARRVSIQIGYPEVMGVSLLAGAEPTAAELGEIKSERDQWFALANQTLARHLQRFGPVVGQLVGGRWRIVGVIPDIVIERPDRPVDPTVFLYLPPIASVNAILVRLEPGRAVEQTAIATVLERIWKTPAPRPFPIRDAVHLANTEYRARSFLLGLVVVLTIPLTMLGVAGALTYEARQRSRDIAIELAIGAEARDIRRRVVRQAVAAAGAASGIGLGLGIGLGELLSSALFGVRAADPITVIGSCALILGVAWAAAFVPARRAGASGPAALLRES